MVGGLRRCVLDYLESLCSESYMNERIRICSSCKYFSYVLIKCSECSCNPEKWVSADKFLNKNYKCPKKYW